MAKRRRINKKMTAFWLVVLIAILFVPVSNLLMVNSYKDNIVSDEQLKAHKADCILILGAGVWEDNKPSLMLKDRLEEGLRLYKAGIAPKILVSGDHGFPNYDEVNVMKTYLIKAGVRSQDVFMDHAGFTTYDSMYRAREVFGVKKAVVVTQEYHLYRALYICDSLGIEAYGAKAYPYVYPGAKLRTAREWLARDKAIWSCWTNAKPKFLGYPIDIRGDGNVTNDKK